MAANDDDGSVENRVDRSVRRLLGGALFAITLLGLAAGWSYFGFYQIEPGQSAIILRLGVYSRTEDTAGLRFHLPPPFEEAEIVNTSEIEREEFGVKREGEEGSARAALEAKIQTGGNSIVSLEFVVQWRVSDAFESRYAVADPRDTLRDAAEAAVREVVGGMSVDGVLSERRGEVASESKRILQDILDSYDAGIEVLEIQLQDVRPPEQVRAAFDDVIASAQDANLAINQAEGYKNEILPRARAEAAELSESANGYRDAKVAEARGEAERFTALMREYHKAPEVTKTRLYLEAMEEVLPDVEKVIIEPGTASVLPYLPLGQPGSGAASGAANSGAANSGAAK